MFRNLLNRIIKKSGLARPEQWLRDAMGAESTHAGVDVNSTTALASSTVAACTRLLAESVASLPLHVYRRTEGGKERAPEHPLYSLLHDKVNALQTSWTWRWKTVADILLHGNAYSIIVRDASNRVSALWPLDPRSVTLKRDGEELYYEVWGSGQRQRFHMVEILHTKLIALDGINGVSVIHLAKHGIGLDLALQTHGSSHFKNGLRPSMVLKHPETLSAATQDSLRESFTERFAGAMNAGKPFLLEGGIDVQMLSFDNDASQFLQSRQFSVQDVCRFFRVSPHLVGDPSRLAYASSEAEFNAFLTHTLNPILRCLEAEMNAVLLPDRTEFLIEFDPNGMARGSLAERYAAYEKGLGGANPWLTVADVRAAENLPYLKGTDQLDRPTAPMLNPTGVANGNPAQVN